MSLFPEAIDQHSLGGTDPSGNDPHPSLTRTDSRPLNSLSLGSPYVQSRNLRRAAGLNEMSRKRQLCQLGVGLGLYLDN
jgi:hypothetical protein